MKNLKLLNTLIFVGLTSLLFGQDTLFMRNGDTIPCKILGESNKKFTIILPEGSEERRVERFDVYDFTYTYSGRDYEGIPKLSQWNIGLAGLRIFGPGYGFGGEFFLNGGIISVGIDISFGSVSNFKPLHLYENSVVNDSRQFDGEDFQGKSTIAYGYYFGYGALRPPTFNSNVHKPIFRFNPEINCYFLPPKFGVRPFISFNMGFGMIQYHHVHLEMKYDLEEDVKQGPYVMNVYDIYKSSVTLSSNTRMPFIFGGSVGVAFKISESFSGKVRLDASLYNYKRRGNSYYINRKDGQTDVKESELTQHKYLMFTIPIGLSYTF